MGQPPVVTSGRPGNALRLTDTRPAGDLLSEVEFPALGTEDMATVQTKEFLLGAGQQADQAGDFLLYTHSRQNHIHVQGILKGGNIGVLAGGRGVLGVCYLLENITHYYYCQSEAEGGEDSSLGPPP